MWGIIPAAGRGSRIQPLAFSKELLPVGSRIDDGVERPRSVTEYLLDRLVAAGAQRLCFVISTDKSDILEFFGGGYRGVPIVYVVQDEALGLCDALFRAAPLIAPGDEIAIGLPDTIWFPEDALAGPLLSPLEFLLFPVDRPHLFDAVLSDDRGAVSRIEVKSPNASTHWVWGAFRLTGSAYHDLRRLWSNRNRRDEYWGSLVNAWLASGGKATAVRTGTAYVDVGTLHGYREALRLLEARTVDDPLRQT